MNTKTSLTISMDNNNKVNVSTKSNKMNKKRKESWDSKVSVSTVSTRVLTRADTPSSILSSDSDIRFTRKLGRQYRCGCWILASFIAFLLIIALGLYVGYTLVGVERNADLVFHGSFRVTKGDSFASVLADPSSRQFFLRARDYKERLNLILRRSRLRPGFIATDVLAFDGVEKEYLVVHFAARFDPRHSGAVIASDVVRVIQSVVLNNSNAGAGAGAALSGLFVDPSSLDVHIEDGNSTMHRRPLKATTTTPEPPPAPPRRCTPLQLDYCRQLPYNVTTYPNVVGHSDIEELNRDVIAFRELVDAECYRHAYDFVCRALQPACVVGNATEDVIVPPCRDLCEEFWEGCGVRIPVRFRDRLKCSALPEGRGSCLRRPETSCVEELHRRDLASRLCDGVPDCADAADEAGCGYCGEGRVPCGTGPVCVAQQEVCDGTPNCPGGVDEKNCLSVKSHRTEPIPLYIQSRKSSEGFVVLTERGVEGKLCTENLNRTVPAPNREATLNSIASWICSLLSYQKAEKTRVLIDDDNTGSYVHMEDPTASDITFVHAPCPTKEILYVSCSQLECGLTALPLADTSVTMAPKAGTWPWLVALTKNDIHVCDGVLVDASWVLTSSSCFQGQDDSNWVAKHGTVRLLSSPPWLQIRKILSRVEDTKNKSLSLVQLDQPVSYTDFVRPICLPEAMDDGFGSDHCTTISWTHGDILESSKIQVVSNGRCENMTFDGNNELCTSSASISKDCSEETPAGNPLMCLSKDNKRWRLVGIHHWGSGCRKTPGEITSAYEKVVSVYDWIKRTITNDEDATIANPRAAPS